MRPLQESLAKATIAITPSNTAVANSSSLPPPLPINEKNRMFNQQHDQQTIDGVKTASNNAPTMQLLNDNISSSYKCFETIATPSPIPIVKNFTTELQSNGTNSNHNNNSNSRITVHHRSTSLDSLANSELNYEDYDDDDDDEDHRTNSQSEHSDDSCCSNSDHLTQSLSDCDSINEFAVEKSHHRNREQNCAFSSKNCSGDCDCGAIQKSTNPSKPIVTDLLKKSTTNKQCTDRDCAYRQFEQHHSIDDCAPTQTTNANSVNEQSSTSNAPFILNGPSNNNNNNFGIGQQQQQQQNQQKTRRTSIASSGSVGRMETIIEEPIEPKISVKEILARFETLTSLEVINHESYYIPLYEIITVLYTNFV